MPGRHPAAGTTAVRAPPVAVRQGQRPAHRPARVRAVHRGDPREHLAQRLVGMARGVGAAQPHGQRQPPGGPHDPGRGLRLLRHTRAADQRGQQGERGGVVQGVEEHLTGEVRGGQARHPVPARHHDRAAVHARRQQMAHLLGVRRVVQHDQHPPSDEQRPVQRGPFVEPERDVGGGESQREQDPGERLGGFQGGRCRSCPRSATKNCPSGKESRVRCAHRRDNVVLPAPAMPLITARLLLCAAVTVSAARPGSAARPARAVRAPGRRSTRWARACAAAHVSAP